MRYFRRHGDSDDKQKLLRRLREAGVSERVSEAMMRVDRRRFVLPGMGRYAWSDESLPIGENQSISQPSLVGRMIDRLETDPKDMVLDVGTGSGYQAAILSLLVESVVSVERVASLRIKASNLLRELGCDNAQVFEAGEEIGWPELAPYDGIIVGAAAPVVPDSLVQQLKIGGKLVIPVGNREGQQLVVVERTEHGSSSTRHEPVRFVPLIGKDAWSD